MKPLSGTDASLDRGEYVIDRFQPVFAVLDYNDIGLCRACPADNKVDRTDFLEAGGCALQRGSQLIGIFGKEPGTDCDRIGPDLYRSDGVLGILDPVNKIDDRLDYIIRDGELPSSHCT